MYAGAFIPGIALAGLYAVYAIGVSLAKPGWAPALPLEARKLRQPDGSSGLASVGVIVVLAVIAAVLFDRFYYVPHYADAALDERLVMAAAAGAGTALLVATVNRTFKLGLLSRMAEQVVFVLIPPLALIFLVLGTIFLGWATPTEGGAMGASGALVMALARRRLSLGLMRQAMDTTAKLSTFVVFILIGARVFSLTFYGVNGHVWVEHLLTSLPGGQLGFLIVVNLIIFFLAFFLDFFELSFIVVPLIGPVADKLGIDLIWFGVLLGVNMQTSFMHPPFGFALFYLRSVAPAHDYLDKQTGKRMAGVTTGQIYWGAIPFVIIQVIMVGLLITFPQMSLVYKSGQPTIDPSKVKIELQPEEAPPSDQPDDIMKQFQQAAPKGEAAPAEPKGGESPKTGEPPKTPEEQQNEELMKQLGGGKK
jgi:TRAP-type mannitol/chloroaromatic compound transport system permease large subunit